MVSDAEELKAMRGLYAKLRSGIQDCTRLAMEVKEELMAKKKTREQRLLEATCGDLFHHIDDLLNVPEDPAAAVFLNAPAPGSPLSVRIINVGHGNKLTPRPAVLELTLMAPSFAQGEVAFFDAPTLSAMAS